MSQQKKMWESLYKPANQESQLIWHSEEIPAFLTRAVELLGGKGNVLDIGCGTGVYAVYMAQKGLQVLRWTLFQELLNLPGKGRTNSE